MDQVGILCLHKVVILRAIIHILEVFHTWVSPKIPILLLLFCFVVKNKKRIIRCWLIDLFLVPKFMMLDLL